MKARHLLIVGFIAIVAMAFSQTAFAKERVVFGGGPAGGTFQVVANGIQVYKPIKAASGFKVQAQSSGGATENLRKTNSGRQQMSTTYSGIVYQGRNGLLKNDTKKYEDVLAVAWLYGAPAQLVVKKGSGIKSTKDLAGKKVGVEKNAMGYNDAAQAFGNNQLDAFWLFTAFPSGAVIMAAQTNDIAMINLDADAENSGFYKKFPYFAKLSVPAGTYKGVDNDTPSFQDSALWIANSKVSDAVVYEMLSLIFTDEGLAHMKAQKKTFKNMSIKNGPIGVVTPFHPGAIKFWKEKGVM